MMMTTKTQSILELLNAEKEKLFQYLSYRLLNIADVEDILQNLYLKVLSNPDRFDNIENKHAYLYKITRNECANHIRESSMYDSLSNDTFASFDAEMLEPKDFKEEFIMINRLLRILPAEQSETIRLRLHSGLSFQEIADIMDIPLSTAKARFRYGIEKLRNGLKRENLI